MAQKQMDINGVDDTILNHFNYAYHAMKDPINDGRAWTKPLLGCLGDVPTCLISCCNPSVQYAINRTTFKTSEADFAQDCCFHCISGCCYGNSCVGANQRHEIRKKGGIKGNYFADLGMHMCCPTLALTQEKQELASLGLVHPKEDAKEEPKPEVK